MQKEFRKLADPSIAEHSQRFFKTGEGDYGHGDVFLGIRVPVIRRFAKDNKYATLTQIRKFIKSRYHEERLLGLLFLVNRYVAAKSDEEKQSIYDLYVASFPYINNWDLVDVTCPHIIGRHLLERDKSILLEWARSEDLWTRRIAMLTNWWFIRQGDLSYVFKIADILLRDEHDLIHKAVGWMLREAGKVDFKRSRKYVEKHSTKMPRTMLRYAIERYPEKLRLKILRG